MNDSTPYKGGRVPRSHRRVMLVLLTDAPGLSGYPLARVAMVGFGKVYVILARLERFGWVVGEPGVPNPQGDRRRFYRLTPEGREGVLKLLGLDDHSWPTGS